MSANCEVCRGEGLVRLPLYRSVVAASLDPAAEPLPSFRCFPCPECAISATVERVKVIQAHALIRVRREQISDVDFMRSRREHIAHMLVGELLRNNLIEFRHRDENPKAVDYGYREPEIELMATVAAISIKDRKRLEDRVAEHQEAFAVEVVAEAAAQIKNFGSHYRWESITKARANDLLTEAVRTVVQRRKQRKAA